MKDIIAIAIIIGALCVYEDTPASQPQQSWETKQGYELRKQRETYEKRNQERNQNKRIERLERQQQHNSRPYNDGYCTGLC